MGKGIMIHSSILWLMMKSYLPQDRIRISEDHVHEHQHDEHQHEDESYRLRIEVPLTRIELTEEC